MRRVMNASAGHFHDQGDTVDGWSSSNLPPGF